MVQKGHLLVWILSWKLPDVDCRHARRFEQVDDGKHRHCSSNNEPEHHDDF